MTPIKGKKTKQVVQHPRRGQVKVDHEEGEKKKSEVYLDEVHATGPVMSIAIGTFDERRRRVAK